MDLTEFLLARIAEDEQAAKVRIAVLDALPDHERAAAESVRATLFGGDSWDMPTFAPDPARVLAECEAKRRAVAAWRRVERRGTKVYVLPLRHLAAAYSDHPDYDESWRP